MEYYVLYRKVAHGDKELLHIYTSEEDAVKACLNCRKRLYGLSQDYYVQSLGVD